MILIDVNILIYAYAASMAEHQAACGWLDKQFSSSTQIALPWETSIGFARVMSNKRIFPDGPDVAEVWEQVDSWLGEPNAWIPTPTRQHAQLVSEFCATGNFSSRDLPDIHLAALAISHGLKLASHDHGFSRFEGLRWFDPLPA